MRAQETIHVLERYRNDLDAVWLHDFKEYRALEKYIAYVSDSEHAAHRVKAYAPHEVLFVFTGRLPAQGMASFMQSFPVFYDANCFITESPQSCIQNPSQKDSLALAEEMHALGWRGEIVCDTIAQTTGDQVEALCAFLANHDVSARAIVTCASIDHVGRMTAVFIDALQSRGLLSADTRLIPFALGAWDDMYMHGHVHADFAFGQEPREGEHCNVSDQYMAKLSGQYTFRWQRSLDAKTRGEYLGRAIVQPSEALAVVTRGDEDK